MADAALVDVGVIRRVEQERGPGWRANTAHRILLAIHTKLAISRADAAEFAALTGLSPRTIDAVLGPESVEKEQQESIEDLLKGVVKALGRDAAISVLSAALKAAQTAKAAHGGRESAGRSSTPASGTGVPPVTTQPPIRPAPPRSNPPRSVALVHPPDGGIVVTEHIPVPAPRAKPPRPKARPKRKTG